MDILFKSCAGMDVHQKTVVVCRMYQDSKGKEITEKKTFFTMTRDLLQLSDWLTEANITHIAMESTGDYWKSVYNILESNFEIWVVNAHHVKNVPGRKTDIKDSVWLCDLMRHGLLRPSFIPCQAQRELRDLTRLRTVLIRGRANDANRLHKALETCNIKLGAVVSDILGVSSRLMLKELVFQEHPDPSELAQLAKGRLQSKQDMLELALDGRMTANNRFVITTLLETVEYLDKKIQEVEDRIEQECQPFNNSVLLLDTIPAVSTVAAQALISEIGPDMSYFPTAGHLASWLGLCPGNNQSGGKRLSGTIRKGNVYARAILVQVAQLAAKMPKTQFSALYRRITGRRGQKKALIAVAHQIAITIWYILSRGVEYSEPGPNYLNANNPQRAINMLNRAATKHGFQLVPIK